MNSSQHDFYYMTVGNSLNSFTFTLHALMFTTEEFTVINVIRYNRNFPEFASTHGLISCLMMISVGKREKNFKYDY